MVNSFLPQKYFIELCGKPLKRLVFTWCFVCFAPVVFADASSNYYEEVKAKVFSDPYQKLPQYQVKHALFDKGGRNLLLGDAKRTLNSQEDLIDFQAGQKLLQANGICFAGEWQMSADSPYTGLFAAKTTLPVIVRASVSLSGTKQKHKRAFAIAIKIFPKNVSDGRISTQNIFLMHSLGGIKTKYVLDLELDNEPELGSLPPWTQWLTAYRLESDLEEADRSVSGNKANARFRPVAQLANLDENGNKTGDIKAPQWLRASVPSTFPRADKNDFRDELDLANYPKQTLVWELYGADLEQGGKSNARWQAIGQLVLKQSVVSKSCDTKLHFAHPAIN